MTEALTENDLRQNTLHRQCPNTDPAAEEILEGLQVLRGMQAYAATLDVASNKFLDSRVMDEHRQSLVDASEFGGSSHALYETVARAGRKRHRDPYELENTTLKVASVLARLDGPEVAYTKSRPKNPGEGPQYALGKIASTIIAIEPDHPEVPLGHRAVVRLTIANLREPDGNKEVTLLVDDIAAQFGKHSSDTGPDTPIVAVGAPEVRAFIQRAYHEPRADRKACGNDSCDIFTSLCESGTRLTDLGFDQAHVERLRLNAIAGLKRVCRQGATYNHEILMLPPLCESLEEAVEIIKSICSDMTVANVLPELAEEYQLLAALRPR